MDWNNTNVFVTGAGGFIGSHLCSHLVQLGAKVTAMLHYNSRSDWSNLEFLHEETQKSMHVVKGNVEDSSFMDAKTKGQNIIFHLAALIGIPYSYEAPLSYVKTNIQGTVNVLEAARKNDVDLVINTSTSETYGTAVYTPIDELHPLQGQSPYSATKIAADKLAESYFNSFALPIVTVRPFNTYGPRQSSRAVIPTIVSQLLTKEEIFLGGLAPVRDFTYVEDTVKGFIAAAEAESIYGELINLGFGKASSIKDLVHLVMKVSGIHKPVKTAKERMRPKDSEVLELICDNSKALDLLRWKPEVSLNEGLEKTINFISQNINLFKKNHYTI